MTMAIGVLCARVRVEEKQLIAALETAGISTMPIEPAALPLPPNPTLHDVQQLAPQLAGAPLVMIDRIANRAIGRIINRLLRQAGVTVIDGGVASRRNRLQVATVWDSAGVPRPQTLVAFSEATAVTGANQLGYPATMFPMIHSSNPMPLADEDTADAVIEHRVVLGTDEEEIVMLQAGAITPASTFRIHVAGFTAVAVDGDVLPPSAACVVAEQAARAIDGGMVAIDVMSRNDSWVAWDAVPVADFRKAILLTDLSVASAIAAHAHRKLRARESEVRDVVLIG